MKKKKHFIVAPRSKTVMRQSLASDVLYMLRSFDHKTFEMMMTHRVSNPPHFRTRAIHFFFFFFNYISLEARAKPNSTIPHEK